MGNPVQASESTNAQNNYGVMNVPTELSGYTLLSPTIMSGKFIGTSLSGVSINAVELSGQTFTGPVIVSGNLTNTNVGPAISGQVTYPATYTVYFATSNIVNARNQNNIVRFSGIPHTVFQETLNDMSVSGGNKGGLLYVLSGTYLVNSNVQISVSGTGSYVHIKGQDRDNVIVTATGTSAFNLFSPFADTKFDNITLDGGNGGVSGRLISCGQPASIWLENCRFTHNTNIGVHTLQPDCKALYVNNCIFEKPIGWQDQCAFWVSEQAIITNNVFSRISGTISGTCLSTGGCKNTVIKNNVFRKGTGTLSGISNFGFGVLVEPGSAGDFSNIVIEGNTGENAGIRLGTTNNVSGAINNTIIANNVIRGQEIGLVNHVTEFSGRLNNITITNNQVLDSDTLGIRLLRAGPQSNLLVTNNFIKDSNLVFNTHAFNDDGLMQIATVGGAKISDNLLLISNTASGTSPYGIRCESGTSIMFNNNHIINIAGNGNTSFTNTSDSTVVNLNVTQSGLVYSGPVTASSAPTPASGGAVPTHAKGWVNSVVSGAQVLIPFY